MKASFTEEIIHILQIYCVSFHDNFSSVSPVEALMNVSCMGVQDTGDDM